MRKLAQKLGFTWAIIGIIPVATLVGYIGKSLGVSSTIIVSIQIPELVVQLLGLFMIIRYRKEIFE